MTVLGYSRVLDYTSTLIIVENIKVIKVKPLVHPKNSGKA